MEPDQSIVKKELIVAEMIEDTGKPEKIMDIYRTYESEYAAQAERALVRKIDKRILPLIAIIYLFNYLDRNSITQARLYGLQKDTKVNGAVYQTAISIFSAGYVFMQLPSTLLMTKPRPSVFLVSSQAFSPRSFCSLPAVEITHPAGKAIS
jgi:hypothetical protein